MRSSTANLVRAIREPVRELADWVYPVGCLVCGDACHRRVPICLSCRRRLPRFADPICPVCRSFASAGGSSRVCQAHAIGSVALLWCAGLFDDGYRAIVHGLKYERELGIGEHFGRSIGRLIAGNSRDDLAEWLVVPVPLHPSRERQRGYNQSTLIANGLARAAGMKLVAEVLTRVRKTKDQTRLTPEKRALNVRDAFRVIRKGSFAGRHVILVDDVMTTGATLMECARTVLADEAARVDAAVIAIAQAVGTVS